jgi:hypothetical protein
MQDVVGRSVKRPAFAIRSKRGIDGVLGQIGGFGPK